MNSKSKEHRSVCRLIVVKIVDSGPIKSNNIDSNQNDMKEEQVSNFEHVVRHSPPLKRSYSPIPTANMVNNKKVKLDQSTNNNHNKQKNQVQTVIKNQNQNKIIVNKKKIKLISHKSSSLIEEKVPKTGLIKESNQLLNGNNKTNFTSSDLSSLSKPRTSIKLTKSQSTNDIKSSVKSPIINLKKKDSALSPSKTKPVTNPQTVAKKVIKTNLPKISTKSEPTVQSSSNVSIKQESPPQSTSLSISNLKKIPKKSLPSSTVEKRSRSSIPSSSLNRKSIRDSQKQDSSSKPKSNLKRQHSSLSINVPNSNNNNSHHQSSKININKDRSSSQPSNVSQSDQSNHSLSSTNTKKRQTPTPPPFPKSAQNSFQVPTPPKFFDSPLQSQIDLPIPSTNSSLSPIETSQPPILDSPSPPIFQNEDNHIQLSDESNSAQEQIPIPPTRITSYSDQSDTNMTDNDEEEQEQEQQEDEQDDGIEDLPTSLTDDDLRYKLIYIYKRFQLNALNDLIIFVQFFKRHQLIDISSLSMKKTSNEMFTYDLFSLTPSHIIELANDLGYTTTSIINSNEQ